jgi:class 3 adenylate cyclase
MAFKDDLEKTVDNVFATKLEERQGRVVPNTEDIRDHQAVKLDATFLYADLAGSARIAAVCPWDTTAKIIRAYLACASKIIRRHGGEIRSFDGDRVMGVFIGNRPNSAASECAREILWATDKVIQPRATANFKSVKNNNVLIRQACGTDCGESRAVRAGIRDNADLIWIGKAPSFAAKLSDLRNYPYCTFISTRVFNKLHETAKTPHGTKIWEATKATVGNQEETIYKSKFYKEP